MVWKVVIGMGTVLGVIGGFYALDSNYVRMNYHEVCFAQVKQDLSAIQKQTAIQRTYDEVFFWQRMEVELTLQKAKYPNDTNLDRKLEEVRKNKEESEKRLKDMK